MQRVNVHGPFILYQISYRYEVGHTSIPTEHHTEKRFDHQVL